MRIAYGKFGRGVVSMLLLLGATSCSHGQDPATSGLSRVRAPAVAGMFYEAGKADLSAEVQRYIGEAKTNEAPGRLIAAVVPHAGYRFSARCAASAYRLVGTNQYRRVIVLGPSHYAGFRGVAVPAAEMSAFRTPLGDVPIAQNVCAELRQKPPFVTVPGADAREHSIEVQLPFLQQTVGSFDLVPLLCGAVSLKEAEAAAAALVPLLDESTLLIASSDFTHYGPNYEFMPFETDVRANLYAWLKESSEAIAALDVDGFVRHCADKADTICGRIPITILLNVLKPNGGLVHGRVLDTYTSGDVVGDYRNSVSYAAIGFFSSAPGGGLVVPKGSTLVSPSQKEGKVVKEHCSGTWTPGLSDEERATLFAIARDTVSWCVNRSKEPFSWKPYTITPKLKVKTATFVTLKIQGELRGCIGSLAPTAEMVESVHDNAVNAALRDPRFDPLRPAEVKLLEIDVSLLSPISEIPSPDSFKIGANGIIIEKGFNRAVYLPEVAVEQGWTKEQTLSSLCQKAGLNPDAWRSGARFKVFESVVLTE